MTSDAALSPAEFPVAWRYAEDEQQLWSHDRLHYPDPVTPLEFSLIEDGVDAGITRAARAYDIPITVHDRHINSYLYIAIEPHVLPAAEGASLAERSSAKLHDAMADLRARWETTWLPEIREHLAWWAGFDLAAATLPALRQHLAETQGRWQRLWEIHFLLFVPSMFAISEFADLYSDLLPDAEPFAPYELLAGFPSKTVESGQLLWELSRRILDTPPVHEIFRDHVAQDVLAQLDAGPASRLFLAELERYLAAHGQRADKVSLHHPYWVEDPTPVITNLQNYIQQPDRDLHGEMQRISDRREMHVADLRDQLRHYPGPVRDQVEFLLRAAQAGAFLKEEHGYWIDYKASYVVRQVLLTIGQRLTTAGILADGDELFYLHMDEVEALLASETPASGADAMYRPRIAVRKAQADRFADVVPPPLLGTLAEPFPTEAPRDPITEMFRKIEGDAPEEVAATGNLIVGRAGSPGVVQGTVKVVHGLGEATKLKPGDILVADTTAPPWTPLFASVGGLVTNSGGILSHSAVVAREYGIPAVVGAHRATERLHDGQRVEVDGSLGIVRILE